MDRLRTIFVVSVLFFVNFHPVNAQVQSITRDQSQNYVIRYHVKGDNELRKGKWVPGNLVNPGVVASVKVVSSSHYKYVYQVRNSEDSNLDLYKFKIQTLSNVKNISYQKYQWHARYIGWQSQVKWSYKTGSSYGIPPGQKEVFSFESEQLPTIGFGYASNLTGLSFPREDEELPVFIEVALDSLRKKSSFVSFQTVVPKKLPNDINPNALQDTLQSYLAFSCDTTWIKNKGTCRSLEAKLDQVERQIDRNTNTAANTLQAFLNELEALKEKQISSEAYGLLYFNGQILLEKLRE
ncbi:MAG TPA: hypothetical protein VJ964_01850 [Balneolaceae bacterium]|nr:hypothetical protein [Balneolaceae bacterium]